MKTKDYLYGICCAIELVDKPALKARVDWTSGKRLHFDKTKANFEYALNVMH